MSVNRRYGAALLGGLFSLLAAAAHAEAGVSRQAEVARKGVSVMPFDLARTTHFFDDRSSGGIETVTANDRQDGRQVGLVRSHLAEEATRFVRGDFSDPAKIHGVHMPGLATLAAAGDKLRVVYREVPGGASLRYESRDAAVVSAIHRWFAAQRSDHDAHMHLSQQEHRE